MSQEQSLRSEILDLLREVYTGKGEEAVPLQEEPITLLKEEFSQSFPDALYVYYYEVPRRKGKYIKPEQVLEDIDSLREKGALVNLCNQMCDGLREVKDDDKVSAFIEQFYGVFCEKEKCSELDPSWLDVPYMEGRTVLDIISEVIESREETTEEIREEPLEEITEEPNIKGSDVMNDPVEEGIAREKEKLSDILRGIKRITIGSVDSAVLYAMGKVAKSKSFSSTFPNPYYDLKAFLSECKASVKKFKKNCNQDKYTSDIYALEACGLLDDENPSYVCNNIDMSKLDEYICMPKEACDSTDFVMCKRSSCGLI